MLKTKTALVTAGPTYEPIDPVRFIGNYSSGKMGFSIAEVLAENGANVVLLTGPSNETVKNPNIQRVDVTTSEDMYKKGMEYFSTSDITVCAAAVADYKPTQVSSEKIKKEDEVFTIELTKTIDILNEFGKIKKKGQILVGFALETNNELENAKAKLSKKNLDFIVLNSLNDENAGFQHDTNKVTFIDINNDIQRFELKSKKEVAKDIVEKIITIASD